MTVAHSYPARKKYRCDICGTEEFWGPTWARYSSMAHDETCPDEMPTACSDACKKEMDARLSDKRMVLPKLKLTPGGFDVVKPRRGY